VKLRAFILMVVISLSAVLTILVRLAAQEQQNESTTTVTVSPVPLINQPLLPDAIRSAPKMQCVRHEGQSSDISFGC
jgi:hypothetical protein